MQTITIKSKSRTSGRIVHSLYASDPVEGRYIAPNARGYLVGTISENADGFMVNTRNLEQTHLTLEAAIAEAMDRVGIDSYQVA